MKLRNKRTGEIYDFKITPDYDDVMSGWKIENKDFGVRYYSHLAELKSEWEDVPEEPKEYWYISAYGNLAKTDVMTDLHRGAEEIGNYFETKEEAEKAVERLCAWKRLKDKGFRFDGYDVAHNSNGDLCGQLFYNAGDYCIEDVEKDLDLLFCPEENI